MDWWRACTKARTRLPNIYHIPMHKWQSLKLMWLLFVQIQIFEGDETTRRRSKRNGDDAAMRLLGQSEFDVSMHWNGVCLKIYIMAHIFETTQPKVLKVHTTYIYLQSCHVQIEFELSVFWSEADDEITYILTHRRMRHFLVGHTISSQHLYSWNDAQSSSLSIHILASIVSVCLFHSGGACIGDCVLILLFLLFIKIHFASHYLSSFTIQRATNVH